MRLFSNVTKPRERRVERVLVMLDYGADDPCSGEVFDVTALAADLAQKDEKHHHAKVVLEVTATTDYSQNRLPCGAMPLKSQVGWNVMVAFDSSGLSGWLDDAVNAAMPTTSKNELILKGIRKTEKKLEQMLAMLKEQRLDEAALVRGKHPVCRITERPMRALKKGGEV